MRFVAAFAIVFAFSATSFAEHGVPNSQTLSAMGLADMQILTDHEGLAIRGKATGAKDREPSDKMLWYQQGTEDFRLHVSEYKERLANRSSAKADWYRDARTNYRSSIASFKSSIGG